MKRTLTDILIGVVLMGGGRFHRDGLCRCRTPRPHRGHAR